MTDLLTSIKRDIDGRLRELRPLVEEARQLESALAALERDGATAAPAAPGASTGGGSARRRRRAPSSPGGERAARGAVQETVLSYVRDHAPVTAGDVAKATGLARTSVATTLSKLTQAGRLVKAQRGYAPAAEDGAPARAEPPAADEGEGEPQA